VFDALLSLGALFDPDSGVFVCLDADSDVLFVASTHTPPRRRFQVDALVSGEPSITDVVLSIKPAVWRDPLLLLDVVERAAAYVTRRLAAAGARMATEAGEPYDPAAARAQIADVVRRLGALGLEAGEAGVTLLCD
jgi:hypothetical protein